MNFLIPLIPLLLSPASPSPDCSAPDGPGFARDRGLGRGGSWLVAMVVAFGALATSASPRPPGRHALELDLRRRARSRANLPRRHGLLRRPADGLPA